MAVKPVSEEPELSLCDWRILRDDREGNLHLMGHKIIKNNDGAVQLRVTSALQYLHLHDDGTMSYITSSGRRYKLVGDETDDALLIAKAIQGFWRDCNAIEYVTPLSFPNTIPVTDSTIAGVRP